MDEITRHALAAQRGRPGASAAFVRAAQTPVWRYCAHLVDPHSADDLTQDTLLHALRALPSYRGESSARTWLLTIARRVCARELDTRKRQRALATAATTHPVAAQRPDHAGRTELLLLINTLDPERRAAFTLTQLLGCSYHEAAEICGCPIGTIRSRVARAREDLINALTTPQHAPQAQASPSPRP